MKKKIGFWTGVILCSIIATSISGTILYFMPKGYVPEYTDSELWSSSLDNINATLNDVTEWNVYVEIYDRWNETERGDNSSIAIHIFDGMFFVYHNCTGYKWYDIVNSSGNYSIRYDYIDDYTIQHCYVENPGVIV